MTQDFVLLNVVAALATAAAGALVAQRLSLPPMIGYVLAGIAIGPFTPGFVGDPVIVSALADIGIVLLMFAIGARLPMAELRRVGVAASVGATVQVAVMIVVGTVAGRMLGFGNLEAVFLGAVVSNSSSTVITKVLGERGEIDSEHGRLALAWSSVQDLTTVVLIVVLTSLASGAGADPVAVALAVGRAALFLLALAVAGGWLLQRLLRLRVVLASREVFVVALASGALVIAFVSTKFGLSLALGAFAAGMVVAETDVAHHALAQISPVRDVFAATFFVAVGMLVHPAFVLRHVGGFVAVLVLIVVVKPAVSAATARVLGSSAQTTLFTAVALGQSAEFSFLLARVGSEHGVLDEESFNVLLSACVASVVLAPLGDRAARRVATTLRSRRAAEVDGVVPEGGLDAVVCGYGRVGAAVCDALAEAGRSFSVVEVQAPIVRELRGRSVDAVLGDASQMVVLERAGVTGAKLVVVALPDAFDARVVVDHVRDVAPVARIVARTHSERDRAALVARGVHAAVVGETELARAIARTALDSLDVPAERVDRIARGLGTS